MSALNPNQADAFSNTNSYPDLSGKTNNYQADVFTLSETLRSLAPSVSAGSLPPHARSYLQAVNRAGTY